MLEIKYRRQKRLHPSPKSDQNTLRGIRAELDSSDDRMQKKVRNAQMQKIPFMVIAGEEDMNAGAVSFRYRNGDQKNGIPIADAIAEIKHIVADRKQV